MKSNSSRLSVVNINIWNEKKILLETLDYFTDRDVTMLECKEHAEL